MARMSAGIVPPYLLSRLAQSDAPEFQQAAVAAQQTLVHDEPKRAARLTLSIDAEHNLVAELTDAPNRTISDARNTETLPGRQARAEGDDPVADIAVNEAYDGLGATFALYSEVYGRNSIDGNGLPLDGTVHYGKLYDNDNKTAAFTTAITTSLGNDMASGWSSATVTVRCSAASPPRSP